ATASGRDSVSTRRTRDRVASVRPSSETRYPAAPPQPLPSLTATYAVRPSALSAGALLCATLVIDGSAAAVAAETQRPRPRFVIRAMPLASPIAVGVVTWKPKKAVP